MLNLFKSPSMTGGSSLVTRRQTPCYQSRDWLSNRKPSSSWTLWHQGPESTGILSHCFHLLQTINCHFPFQLLAVLHVRLLHGLRPGVQVQPGHRRGRQWGWRKRLRLRLDLLWRCPPGKLKHLLPSCKISCMLIVCNIDWLFGSEWSLIVLTEMFIEEENS